MNRTITRKEIAAANDISDTTVRRKERALGLHRCRDRVCRRPIRYHAAEAAARLRAARWNVPEQ